MAETRVTVAELTSSADQLDQDANRFKTTYEELFQRGRELDTTWDGDANDKFNEMTKNDQPKFESMYNTLVAYIKALREAARIYSDGEKRAVDQVTTRTKGH